MTLEVRLQLDLNSGLIDRVHIWHLSRSLHSLLPSLAFSCTTYSSVVYSGISTEWWIFGGDLASRSINSMFAVSSVTLCGVDLNVRTIVYPIPFVWNLSRVLSGSYLVFCPVFGQPNSLVVCTAWSLSCHTCRARNTPPWYSKASEDLLIQSPSHSCSLPIW